MTKEAKAPDHVGEVKLVLSDYIPYVNPAKYGIKGTVGVDPNQFYVTSGDAVIKAEFMEKKLWEFATLMKRQYGKKANKRTQQFLKDTWSAASKARGLINYLKKVRGPHVFLECEHRDHNLFVIPKDPRGKEVEAVG